MLLCLVVVDELQYKYCRPVHSRCSVLVDRLFDNKSWAQLDVQYNRRFCDWCPQLPCANGIVEMSRHGSFDVSNLLSIFIFHVGLQSA